MTASALLRSVAKALFYTPNTIRYDVEMIRLREAIAQIGHVDHWLDAGAGGGHYASQIYVHECRRLTIVEPFADNMAVARQTLAKYAEKTTFIQSDIAGMPVEDRSVDCVSCTQVLEHIEDDNAAVAEFSRIVKPGGYALITVPTPPEPWPMEGHVREGYTEPQLTGLFSRHGMERLRTDWFMTRDTLGIGRILVKCGGIFPKVFALSELRTTLAQRRDNGPYCILGLFRKTQ
jgi:ubiquinone/menaquinone biosynthesis C-methylase UbiE